MFDPSIGFYLALSSATRAYAAVCIEHALAREDHERMKMTTKAKPNIKYLRVSDVAEKLKVSCSTVYDYVHSKGLPAPVVISPRCSRWVESEVDQWMRDYAARAGRVPPVRSASR